MRTMQFTVDQLDFTKNLVSTTHTIEIPDDIKPFDAMSEFMKKNKTGAGYGQIISVSASNSRIEIDANLEENVTVEYVASCGDCNAELNRWEETVQSEEVTCHICGAINSISNDH